MKLFALIHNPAGDRSVSYDGMNQATITNLQTFPFEFIDEATYNAFVVANTPEPLTPAEILTDQRAGAVAQMMTDPSSQAKALRGTLILAMNEFNLVRQWLELFKAQVALATTLADLKTRVATLPAMPDRTAVQLKTAFTTIENAGTAD